MPSLIRTKPTQIPADTLTRVLARVERVTESGCWIWMGALTNGYGTISVKHWPVRTHRVTYEALKGPIPVGLEIDHLCRVRCCCNPDHLEAVTGRVNAMRGEGVGAVAARKTHCPAGHPLSGDNVRMEGPEAKYRRCRACQRERNRRAKAARRNRAVA